MGSPSMNKKCGSFIGAAADLTIYLDFTPRVINFAVENGGPGEFGMKTDEMSGSSYISTTSGTDAGVTIGDKSFVVANGADINVAGNTVYFVATE